MQEAVEAYQQTAKVAASPRQLEASLLLKAATQLQDVRDSWSDDNNALESALVYNRRLWTVFVGSMASEENPLPQDIRNNVASLGAFVFSHTIDVQMNPAPEKLETLININKELAAGLNSRG